MLTYIDTHVACWLYAGQGHKLNKKVMNLMDESSIRISPMSVLELEYLYEIKRITASGDAVMDELKKEYGLKECDADYSIVSKEARKLHWTRDPFDRIITAQASIFNAPLITCDSKILKHYSQAVW